MNQTPATDIAPGFPSAPDVRYASDGLAALMSEYFLAKSAKDLDRWLATFSPDQTFYADATLGWTFDSLPAMRSVLETIVPNWGDGLSYSTRILGDLSGAIVFVTDTPQLFGSEIRAIAAVDLVEGKIVRFVDYWDGRRFGAATAAAMRTPVPDFPVALGEDTVSDAPDPAMADVVRRLHSALGSHAHADAAALFAEDAVLEDMALHAQFVGRSAIGRYLRRATASLPWAGAARLVHVLGSSAGGGYEWRAIGVANDGAALNGVVALELNENERIIRFTTVWDAARIDDGVLEELVLLSRDEGPSEADPW